MDSQTAAPFAAKYMCFWLTIGPASYADLTSPEVIFHPLAFVVVFRCPNAVTGCRFTFTKCNFATA